MSVNMNINTIFLNYSKSAEQANTVFKAYYIIIKQQCSGKKVEKQVQVLEYECSVNKVPGRKSQVQIKI